jgi:hypothetical protein
MTPAVRFAYYALWISYPIMQSGVAAIMLWRKLHRKFPVFFAYLVAQVAIFAVIFPISLYSYSSYFLAYWITATISLVLGFMVIHEIFVEVFRPYHTLKDLGTVLFKWAGLVMVLAACVVGAASQVNDQGPLVSAVLTVQRCVRVIQCGLILFLLLFSRYLGVSWRQRSFGIALGFGAFAGTELFSAALRASGSMSQIKCNFAIMASYNIAIVVWGCYMWAKQAAREAPATLLASQRWEESLTDLQHPMSPDSLIPMFEGMVDRALSRAHEDVVSEQDESQSETSDPVTPSAR